MQRVTRITCPSCSAPLRSARGVRIGKRITCLRCQVAFTVRPQDAEEAERAAGVNPGRLLLVLVGAALYLLSGTGLALYCFANNSAPEQPRPQISSTPANAGPADAGKLPPQPAAVTLPLASDLTPAEQLEVDRAIARGVWFLREHVLAGGTWGLELNEPGNNQNIDIGMTCMPALTLLECGVPPSDPLIQGAAKRVREGLDKINPGYETYERALVILFLDRLGAKQDLELIQYHALCLIAAQHPEEGAWTYRSPALDRAKVPQLLKRLGPPTDAQALLRRETTSPKSQISLAEWRQNAGVSFVPGDWDHSNTQFAILALLAAEHRGVSIDRTMALVEKHFRSTQLSLPNDPERNNVSMDGSWYYDRHGPPGFRNSSRWPSMTCAGLLGVAAGHGAALNANDRKQRPLDDPAIKKGLAMLAREIDRPGDTARHVDYYFLWSLERVGVLFQVQKIGGKDWYAWGRKVLLPRQMQDGSWRDGGYYGSNNNPALDTCFVLLFLKQANLAKTLTDKLELLAAAIAAPPGQIPAKKD